jgi:sulfur-oxidizing protein SoxA
MKKTGIVATVAALALCGQMATADENAELVIDGQQMVTKTAAPEGHPLSEILSGWRFRTDETQALETDDFDNPAFIFVEQAAAQWETVEGTEGKSCATCHGDVSESMKGVRAGMPKWNAEANDLWSLENYINNCRTTRMGAEALKWGKPDMDAMVALIGLQSRGMPVNVDIEGPAHEWWERGKEMYYTRYGQLELACSNCHEDNAGNMIRADHLSQGQTNGFPTYRLKNTKLNSIHDRFKGCIRDTRAETFSPGSAEFRALELYVAWRGQGLSVETPSVRN